MTYQTKYDFGRVGVLMGGWAGEREVSLVSGAAVLQGLQEAGVDAVGVDVDRGIGQVLKQEGFDRVFNVVHGPGGEDGVLQGILEALEIPYTGCGVMASALSMDKLMTKRLWSAAGISTPGFEVLTADTDFDAVIERLGLPLMVKPACEGSSLGMSKVSKPEELEPAYELAAGMTGEAFAEQWVHGREFTAGILKGKSLPLIELKTHHEFYDYDAKYLADDTQYICPCDLDEADEKAIREKALEAFEVLNGRHWGRVDVLCDEQGKAWFIELNTVPGMTSHSLIPMAAKVNGLGFSELVCEILSCTLEQEA